MSLISSMQHAYAVVIGDLRKAGSFVAQSVLPALQKADASAATVEAITGLVSPQLANIERTADALLGLAIKAIEDAGTAVGSGGMNLSLDAALVADLKAIMPAIKTAAAPIAAAVPKAS